MADTLRETIVVIDDDPHHLQFVVALLERAGYVAVGFSNAESALAEIDELAPSLIVTDIFMPHVDGFDVLRRAKTRTPPIPVVAMSGKTSGGQGTLYLDSMRLLGAIAAFVKPVVGRELVGTIDYILGGPPQAKD
jgi:CheY-like chemotaxis protein